MPQPSSHRGCPPSAPAAWAGLSACRVERRCLFRLRTMSRRAHIHWRCKAATQAAEAAELPAKPHGEKPANGRHRAPCQVLVANKSTGTGPTESQGCCLESALADHHESCSASQAQTHEAFVDFVSQHRMSLRPSGLKLRAACRWLQHPARLRPLGRPTQPGATVGLPWIEAWDGCATPLA